MMAKNSHVIIVNIARVTPKEKTPVKKERYIIDHPLVEDVQVNK